MVGGITEASHVPSKNLTIAIPWNDNLLTGPQAGFLPALLRAALGSES